MSSRSWQVARAAAVAAVLAVVALAPSPAAAKPPDDGRWTQVREDKFEHWACRAKAKDGWRVRTATWWNNRRGAVDHGIGVWAALARGGNDRLADDQTAVKWNDGWIRITLTGARGTDRLWMQGAYYGPPEPWSDGLAVAKLRRCS